MESITRTVIPDAIYEKYINRTIESETGCWIWQGSLNSRGYGHLRYGGKWWLTHRFVCTYHYGPIPEGLVVRHICHNRACMNPKHLLVGTHQENVNDQIQHGTFHPRHVDLVEWYRKRNGTR